MVTTIATSGKGRAGKTTIDALVIRFLLEQQNKSSVLAVIALGAKTSQRIFEVTQSLADKI